MKTITVNDKMQKGYTYRLTEPIGKNFHQDFKPELTPKEMLELGVFDGKYMTDCGNEFPKDWYINAKLSPERPNPEINFFKIHASKSLKYWKEKGWIYYEDPRGWFQWYCRYYMGRRIPQEDERQIKRWKAFKRHIGQLKKNCRKGDMNCRRKQRQALLHWAYDSRKY
jgi:ribosomal protein L35